MITEAGAETRILIALDRQEKGAGDSSAVQKFLKSLGCR